MKISVVIPCRNEAVYIEDCLRSLQSQARPAIELELIVVDGCSTDETPAICQRLQEEYGNIVVVTNHRRYTPFGLNLGVRSATGEFVLISSAHAAFAPDYIERLLEARKRYGADVVGGVMLTDVKHHTDKALAIKAVLSSRIGVGNAMFRIGVSEPTRVDTVPFGLYPRSLFDEVGYYDERLIRNHDIELSKRLIAKGKTIMLVPDAVCTYYARETYAALASNNYRNGMWNMLTVRITRNFKSLSLRHFIPLPAIIGAASAACPAVVAVAVGRGGLGSVISAADSCCQPKTGEPGTQFPASMHGLCGAASQLWGRLCGGYGKTYTMKKVQCGVPAEPDEATMVMSAANNFR